MIEDTEELETESVDTPETDEDEGFLPQPGDEADTDEVDAEDEDGEEEEGEEEAPLIEVERGGKTYKIPAELKDEFLMQGDYTRKTQELAELRKQIEPLVQQAEQVSHAETQALAALGTVNLQISQYENIDWQTWRMDDPQAALQAQVDLQSLLTQRSQIENAHKQAQAQRLSITAQETARRMEEGRKVLAEKIPDFATKAPRIAEFAMKEFGFTAQELGEIEDPRAFIALNRLLDLEEQVKSRKVEQKVKQAVEIKPAAKIKGKAGSVKTGLHDGLSTAEWIRRDRARAAQRR